MARTKKIIIGNWKMYPASLKEAKNIFLKVKKATPRLKNTTVVACPPSLYLSTLGTGSGASKKFFLGAQNVFWEKEGAFTGEISSHMVKEIGAKYVIVGHSERRKLGETDEMVNRKVQSVLGVGLIAVICVGEADRDGGGLFYEELKSQIHKALLRVSRASLKNIIIAYEPVWAIGKTAKDAITAQTLRETYIFIRKVLTDLYDRQSGDAVSIIYGGSAEPENVEALMLGTGVEGFLVGHKSLVPEAFIEMIKIIDRV
jgi:triosephosphate isomerase